jgi:hypothetical protein
MFPYVAEERLTAVGDEIVSGSRNTILVTLLVGGKAGSMKGCLPGELQTVITVIDESNLGDRGKVTRYTGTFVELFRLKEGWRHNNRHGMIEAQRANLPAKDNIQSLARRRFYGLNLVQRSAHLVPAGRSEAGHILREPLRRLRFVQ